MLRTCFLINTDALILEAEIKKQRSTFIPKTQKKVTSFGLQSFWIYLFIGSFLIFYVSEAFEKSMFIDGVWYAVISRNLSEGIGSFWFPQFSQTIFSAFHEHPPLMFGLLSIFFSVFGDSFFTERLFGIFQYLLIAFVIITLWQMSFDSKRANLKKWWVIPLLFWQVNLVNYFFLSQNMLDTSICLFDIAAVCVLIKAAEKENAWKEILLGGFLLFLALLSKGLVALFPFAFFAIHWLVFRKTSFGSMLKRTLVMVGIPFVMLGTLVLFNPNIAASIQEYLDVQVMASLKGERRLYYFRENRFYIIGQLFIALAPMIIALMFSFISVKLLQVKKIKHFFKGFILKGISRDNLKTLISSNNPSIKYALLFLLIGLSASLPIMISPRQAIPYLLPSIPYFALAIGIWAVPYFEKLTKYFWEKRRIVRQTLRVGGLIWCFLGLAIVIWKYETVNDRDRIVINDAKQIGTIVQEGSIISSATYDMYISGYLMRFYRISIDTSNTSHEFLLTKKEANTTNIENYQEIPINTLGYSLLKKKTTRLSNGRKTSS